MSDPRGNFEMLIYARVGKAKTKPTQHIRRAIATRERRDACPRLARSAGEIERRLAGCGLRRRLVGIAPREPQLPDNSVERRGGALSAADLVLLGC